jgi:hypothetical protein
MRKFRFIRRAGFIALSLPLAVACNAGSVERKVAAEANGEVIISNVSGTIDVRGWDRNEVHVSGQLDEDVERLDVESSNGRTVVKVVLPRGRVRGGDATIEVQVPKGSSVEVSAVSADVSSRGVLGTQRLKSVSGDVTVRGSGRPISLRVTSVSGTLDLSNVAGKLNIVTVSGDARVSMGETTEIRGRTTSGNLDVRAKLARDGRVDVEGVSGDITLNLATAGALSTEIESFSGDIEGCLAAGKVVNTNKYGPGKRLTIRTVEAGARVRAKTLSGDIDICDR